MKKNSIVNVRVDDALRNSLELEAQKQGMTFADFIRWVLRRSTKKK